MAQIKNPIIKVTPVQQDFKTPPRGGGGGKKLFDGFTPKVRNALHQSLVRSQQFLEQSLKINPNIPGVIKLILREDALAKSHRPTEVLEKADINVIGVGDFGELYLSVNTESLRKLEYLVSKSPLVTIEKNLSAIGEFLPFTEKDILPPEVLEAIPHELKKENGHIKIKLFKHNDAETDAAIARELLRILKNLGASMVESVYYGKFLTVYRTKLSTLGDVKKVSEFIGVQSIAVPGDLYLDKMKATPLEKVADDYLSKPTTGITYPLVGIIDSGVHPNEKNLQPWIVATHNYAGEYPFHDYEHGSFVAGMIVDAHTLNHQDQRFPQAPCKIVDVKLFRTGLTEREFKDAIEDILPKHPEVKVWNISLGVDQACDTTKFSDGGIFLDEMADKYGVIFVVAAGNYKKLPVRTRPPQDLKGLDRIGPPSDSVRALTVGSLAHVDKPTSAAKIEEPSPFSRRGPGPSFIPKPELTHYGGNTDSQRGFLQTGVVSLDGIGNRAENVGTSFSAPIVSSLLANLAHIYPDASNNLLKAMLIHSAVLKVGDIQADDLNYFGFGVPGMVSQIIDCHDHQATSIFEIELKPGLVWDRIIPMPASLVANGKTRAEFNITLVYDPPVDANFGTEYCRSNVEVSLGTYNKDKNGKYKHTKAVPLNPEDATQLYEIKQIEHGMKWSPVKVYRRCIAEGLKADMWRLFIKVMHRSQFTTDRAQRICVILTISDPDKKAPIYSEWIQAINQSAWITNQMQIGNNVQIKVR